MKWILGAFFGLIIAFLIYSLSGTFCNLVIGPLLGYRIQKILFPGGALIREEGRWKYDAGQGCLLPEVLLDAGVNKRWKKLILDICPIIPVFALGMLLSSVFGDVRGVYRHILVGTLSAMAILLCWHIFIVLKMIVYIKDEKSGQDQE